MYLHLKHDKKRQKPNKKSVFHLTFSSKCSTLEEILFRFECLHSCGPALNLVGSNFERYLFYETVGVIDCPSKLISG